MSSPVILWILDCRHVQPGSVYLHEMQCHNCNDRIMHKIVDVHTFEWRAFCKSCNYRAWCGLARNLAEYHANGHVRKHPRHDAKVLYMENPFAIRARDKITEAK